VWADGLLAGLFAGFAIGIKPSSSLFLVAVVLVLVGCRRWRALPAFAAGLAPCIFALTFWKWRGLGYVPLFHAEHAVRLALGGGGLPLGGVHVGRYVNLDWGRLQQNLDTVGEHFWSERVVEWTVIAGIIALGRRSLAAMLLIGGWLAAFLLVKGTGRFGILETGGLLHMLVPAIPPFVVIVAALPFLVPGAARRLRPVRPPRDWGTPQLRTAAVVAATLLFAVAPVALAASAHRATPGSGFVFVNAGPIPVDPGLDLRAVVEGPRVHLTWTPRHAAGAPLFYELVRDTSPSTAPPCPEPWGGICWRPVAVKRGTEFVDKPPAGGWTYRVLVEATWIDRLTTGDDYLASEPVSVRVP